MTVRFGRPIDAGALSAMLADRSLSFCMEFLPAGVREGGEWRIGSVASEPGRSMAVHLSGPKAGVWKDWAADIGGDALDLAAHVLFGGDKGQAVRWSRAWLGLDSADPGSFERRRAEAVKRREEAGEDDQRRQRRAAAIFLAAQPQLAGTLAGTYLAGRAIDLSQLGRQPRSLRFHPGALQRRKRPGVAGANRGGRQPRRGDDGGASHLAAAGRQRQGAVA